MIEGMKYDVLIVGAGPAGIFTAMEMIRQGSTRSIAILEKGCAVVVYCKKNITFAVNQSLYEKLNNETKQFNTIQNTYE